LRKILQMQNNHDNTMIHIKKNWDLNVLGNAMDGIIFILLTQ
jgi:hypothetical protein